jgi:hypothetical protein
LVLVWLAQFCIAYSTRQWSCQKSQNLCKKKQKNMVVEIDSIGWLILRKKKIILLFIFSILLF